MKVKDIIGLFNDGDIVLYNYDSKEAIDLEIDVLLDSEVISVSANKNTFEVYIEPPTEKYYTYLDVTFSTRIEFGVPFGSDKRAIALEKAKELLDLVPDGFKIGKHDFRYDYDNIETGGLEDMIEKEQEAQK